MVRYTLDFMLMEGSHWVTDEETLHGSLKISGQCDDMYGHPVPKNTSIQRTGKTVRA